MQSTRTSQTQKVVSPGFSTRKAAWTMAAALMVLGTVTAAETLITSTEATSVTQYGITWTFDKKYAVGQFINGDWWVVGPVSVVHVTPAPGPAPAEEQTKISKSRYGATATKDDKQMRNGSMIILGRDLENDPYGTGFGVQGYDSRGLNYVSKRSVAFPLNLEVNRSLISSCSTDTVDKNGEASCPTVFSGMPPRINCPESDKSVMKTAAVLTCLDQAPPSGTFRPPYAGKDKPLYQLKDLQWELLSNLKAPRSTPDWAMMERVFERPWLDHFDMWGYQHCTPAANRPIYGREFARMTSMAGLMLLLDVPREKKQRLLIEYVQLGIDLHGLAICGRTWLSEDGGHWIGRKWPILFASLMLNNNNLRAFPGLQSRVPVFGRITLDPTTPAPAWLFCEDTDTYFGKGGDGQTVLGQTTYHSCPRLPFEEKPRKQFNHVEESLNAYRIQNAEAWNGEALAALLMKAKALWNHDAFFDYVDRMMGPTEAETGCFPKWLPKGCTSTMDNFLQDMWNTYRQTVPMQPGGKDNLKWVWTEDKKSGHFDANPKPAN